jgi:putative ABC transport system permease protein
MRRANLHLAFRQLKATKGFTVINILGLTLGLTTFLLIVLYVADELSYDRFNTKADRIYRVNTDLRLGQHISYMADAAPPVAPTLLRNYPAVQRAVRMLPQPGTTFLKGDAKIAEPRVVICDPQVFDIFTLPMIEGNAATALQAPNTVVITESTAKRYFGSSGPNSTASTNPGANPSIIGRTIRDIDDSATLTVTGVIRDLPEQSSFHYDFFISMQGNGMRDNNSFYALFPMSTFILLKPGADPAALQRQLPNFMYKYDKEYSQFDTSNYALHINLTALTDIHLRSNRTDELEPNGNIQYVYIFSAIALFVLLIAAVNFMNLSTARSANRAREVGVRKVLGSTRGALIAQFLSESLLITIVATLLALGLAALILPLFNQLAAKSLHLDGPTLAWLTPAILLLVLTVGLLAGVYPAFFLSAFRPVEVLKGKLSSGFKGGALRSTLVVFQFSVSLFLIVGTLMIYRQLNFIQTKDLGFDRSRVLSIKGTSMIADPITLKREIATLPGVANATLSGFLPTNDRRWHNFGSVKGSSKIGTQIQSWLVDADYIPTLRMQMVEGRNFSAAFGTDSTAIVINETAARAYGITDDPLNKVINLAGYNKGETDFHVIGVVKDFNFNSLRDNITPLAMIINRIETPQQLQVRVSTNNLPALMSQLKGKWAALAPHQPFEYSFMDAGFDALYRSEQRMGQLSILFSVLAIAIACLGLFGLAAYAAEQRTKEIGIRKVLGSGVPGIVALLSKDFLRLIALSILISSPLAWLAMRQWLQNFAYRTTVDPWLFAIAAALVLSIALVTTIFQSTRAALANPIDSLRSE